MGGMREFNGERHEAGFCGGAEKMSKFKLPIQEAGTESEYSQVSSAVILSAGTGSSDLSPRTPVPEAYGLMPPVRHAKVLSPEACDPQANWTMHEVLGRGAFGVVRRATCKRTHEDFAVKSISREQEQSCQNLALEASIASQMKHPNIVCLRDAFQDDKSAHFVMELCSGGNLYDRIIGTCKSSITREQEFPKRGLALRVTTQYMWQILSGIAYLHHHRIAHRDVKPENYFLHSRSVNAPLKLSDFGLSCYFSRDTPMTDRVGSSYCVAPEVLGRSPSYSEKCDIWSIGIVCFFMCVGHPPFWGENQMDILRQVLTCELKFKEDEWHPVHEHAGNIVKEMLTRDPLVRPSAKNLIASHADWLKMVGRIGIDTKKQQQCSPCTIC
jgi:calcium-dependent protein kinase